MPLVNKIYVEYYWQLSLRKSFLGLASSAEGRIEKGEGNKDYKQNFLMIYVGITQSYQNNSQILSSSFLNIFLFQTTKHQNYFPSNYFILLLKTFFKLFTIKANFLRVSFFLVKLIKWLNHQVHLSQKSSTSFGQKIRVYMPKQLHVVFRDD